MRKLLLTFCVCVFCTIPFLGYSQSSAPSDTANFPYWIKMMQDPNADFNQTVRAFEIYWEGREITRGCGFKPFKRWEHLMRSRITPDGKVPVAGREVKAYRKMLETATDRRLVGTWEPLGPFTVPSGYNGYRGLGRINAIEFHPTNSQIIYIGAPSGGLWVSYDEGANWQVLTDHLPTLGVSSILVNTENPNTILIGTGDRDASDAPGLGVWRSEDGGITWAESNEVLGNCTVGRMIQDPNNANYILAATSNGIFRSTDGGHSWTLSESGNFKEIIYKPGNNQIVYASKNGQFWRSEDGGVNFSRISSGMQGGERGVIGVSPANPEIVYFLLCTSDAYQGIYRSTDSGLNFEVRSNEPNIMSWDCDGGSGGQAWYDLDIAVDPTNADIVYGGGVNNFKSTDGGLTWQINSHWYGGCNVPSVHADLHVMEYSPLTGKLYAGNDGGVYWTSNGGTNWTEISNGLVISQAYKIGQSATNANYVANGYQDNGSSNYIGNNWINVGGGDGMECAYDPTDDSYSYSTIYYGVIDRSKNHNYQGQIAGEGVNGITESGNWVTPFFIDYLDGNIMFIGYRNIWRSTNIKAGSTSQVSWTKISNLSGSNMDKLVQSRANTNIIYAASGSRLYLTENCKDNEVNWQDITSLLPTSNTITAIETSYTDENVVYIAQQTRIFKSSDKGNTWEEITFNMADLNINSVALYKNGNEAIYLGTDAGVYYKDYSMDQWFLYNSGMPASARITEIEIFYDPANPENDLLRAGTYGRGLWSASPMMGALEANFEASETSITEGCKVNFSDLTFGVPSQWEWTFEGGTPSTSTEENPTNITYNTEGSYNVSLTVTNPMGTSSIEKEDYITVASGTAPIAEFSADNTYGCAGLIATFSDLSEYCPNLWEWSFLPTSVTFLEGTDSHSQNPVVQFNEATNYDVTLDVSNNSGTNSITKENFIIASGHAFPYSPVIYEDMFSDEWTIINPDGERTWDVVEVMGVPTLKMQLYNYSSPRTRDYAITPVFSLLNAENANLTFKYAYSQRIPLIDSLIISISEDCGETWERIYANGPDQNGIFETSEPTNASFVPNSEEDWCGLGYGAPCPVIDITPWIGKANLQLQFETYNLYGNNLYIKDIVISGNVGYQQNTNQNILISPNPAKDFLRIETNNKTQSMLKLLDVNGRVLLQQEFSDGRIELNVKDIPTGVYTVSIETSDSKIHHKVVIQ